MANVIKTVEDMENLFRIVVLTILRLDITANHKRVRFPWGSNLKDGTGSAPIWKKNEDVCVIYQLPQDDPYNRCRDRRYIDAGGKDLIEVDEHIDVHSVIFVNYGPNAYECAREIRDGLFRNDIYQLLKRNDFYLIPDVTAPQRIPEQHNGEWWNRVDFTAKFNEYVRRENLVKTIEKIQFTSIAITANGSKLSSQTIEERSQADNG